MLKTFPVPSLAVVIGASGGIGSALVQALRQSACFEDVVTLSRSGAPPVDLLQEDSIRTAAAFIAQRDIPVRMIFDATGFLHGDGLSPEKAMREISPAHMAHAYAVNAMGPMLLMKYFLPLLPRDGKSVFATISAKVGSISDNRLGGWYSYRAAKAGLNQFVRTAAIELARKNRQAVCVALHPGTVETPLSGPFLRSARRLQTPDEAAAALLSVLDRLTPADSGNLIAYDGTTLPF